ncbi:MAG TPA: pitrilysin family protein [Bacteroidota bacterium]
MKTRILFIALLLTSTGATRQLAADTIKNNAMYYQQDVRVPTTRLTLVFHGAGEQQETEQLAGLAEMTASLLFRGTPSMSRETISRQFELLGADVDADVSQTDFSVTISCFSKNINQTIDLVEKIMKDASFPQEELELVRKQKLNQLEASLENADGVLAQATAFVAYNGSRFGKFGSRSALGRITRDDVVRYFDNVRRASVLYFTSISDLPKNVVEQKTALFSEGRKTNGFKLKPEVEFTPANGREAFIFSFPQSTNDRFRWTHAGISPTDQRRFDLDLVVDALGSSQGLLFDVLRGKNGWCYGAYAFQQRNGGLKGRIMYYADPTPETSDKLIPEMLHLIQSFSNNPDFQEGLARRNNAFKNRYAYQLDPNFKLASIVNRDRYGIPLLPKEEYYRKVDAVTLESAQKMVQEVFDTKNMQMVFYGDVDRIKPILQGADPSIKITVMEKEVLVQ